MRFRVAEKVFHRDHAECGCLGRKNADRQLHIISIEEARSEETRSGQFLFRR